MTDQFAAMPHEVVELTPLRASLVAFIPPGQVRVSIEESTSLFLRAQFARFERDVHAALIDAKPVTSTHTATVAVTFQVPATWWQAWKQEHARRWWAAWLVRRLPPLLVELRQVRTVAFEARMQAERWAAFPDSTWIPEALGQPVYFMRYTKVNWREVERP